MNTKAILLLLTVLLLSGCAKNFTPATKSDLDDVTTSVNQKTQVTQTCVNENIFVTFEPTEDTKGQITVAQKVILESTVQYKLFEKAMTYEAQRRTVSYGSTQPGSTLKNLKPTVLNRVSDKTVNRAFIKFLCANANSASLQDSSFEKRNPLDKSNNFDFKYDAVQEIWACHGPCTQEGTISN